MSEYEQSKFQLLSNQEVDMWRNRFLASKLQHGHLQFISEKSKNRLTNYFLSAPYEGFTSVEDVWDSCLSALIQNLEEKS